MKKFGLNGESSSPISPSGFDEMWGILQWMGIRFPFPFIPSYKLQLHNTVETGRFFTDLVLHLNLPFGVAM